MNGIRIGRGTQRKHVRMPFYPPQIPRILIQTIHCHVCSSPQLDLCDPDSVLPSCCCVCICHIPMRAVCSPNTRLVTAISEESRSGAPFNSSLRSVHLSRHIALSTCAPSSVTVVLLCISISRGDRETGKFVYIHRQRRQKKVYLLYSLKFSCPKICFAISREIREKFQVKMLCS